MLRRHLRSLAAACVHFVARRPAIHALIKAAYRMVPGLQPLLRRLLPRPPAALSPLASVEAMLKFDRSRLTSGPGRVVTVEDLFLLVRTR